MRLLAILVCLGWAGTVQAFSPAINAVLGMRAAGGTAAYCTGAATCTATYPGECDSLCEDFEGSTACLSGGDAACRSGWTALVTAGGSIDFTTTHGGTLACTDKGTNAVTVTVTNGETGYLVTRDLGADKAVTYTQFYLRVVSEGLAENHAVAIAVGINAVISATTWTVALYQGTTNLYLRLCWNNDSVCSLGTTAVTIGTWYRVRVRHNVTAGTADLKVNDTTEVTVSSGVTGDSTRYLALGSSGWASDPLTTQIDNITVDDDTEPGACNL